jgi:hypothetical protein
MTDEQAALSRRLVTSPRWRWMPGMKVYEGFRVTESYERFMFGVDRPDLADPATLGCLLSLVRAAWRCVVITSPEYDYDDEEARQGPNVIGWRAVETERWMMVGEGVTEAEALVAALEGAP